MRFWNWVKNEDETRTLYLDGAISESTWWGDEITPDEFRSELYSGEGDVIVWINSSGGDVFAAASIYNMLKEYPYHVTVKIDAMAASAASMVAMAGDKVMISPVGHILIHNPSTIAMGDSEEMLKAKRLLDSVKDSIINAYEIKTGLSRVKLSHMMDAETNMPAQTAVALGFADEIMYQDEAVNKLDIPNVAASYSPRMVLNSLLAQIKKGGDTGTVSAPAGKLSASYKMQGTDNNTKPGIIIPTEQRETIISKQNLNGGTGMSDILTLREKRAKTWEAAKAFLDTNRGTDGRLSAENAATYDKMENDVVNMGKEIERLERAREIENEISAITAIPITSMPGSPKPKTGHASAEYNAAFWNAFRGKEISNALKVGVDTEGGYLVPDEFNHQLIEALEAENIFRRLANIVQTASGEKQIPVVATKGTAAWVEEGEEIPESDNTFGQVILYAYKVATMIKVSTELLNDSAFPLEAYIAREFARRIGAKEEEAFFVGDGNKKPTGIFADTGGGQVGKTADSATIITHDDVIDLYYSLKTPYRARASFIANDSTVKMLRKVKSADGQYIWQPSVKEGTPDMIIGRPIYTSSYVPAIEAEAKVLAFGDYSFYWIADRQARMFQRLIERYATTGQVGYLATQRVDGKLILPEAVQVLQMGEGT